MRGPDNSGSSEKVEAIEVLPLPGQPFFANTTITLTHPLADGGSIVFSGSSKTVRDIQGRVYLERRHLSPSANADSEAVLTEFVILDPAARTRTTCVVSSHICRIKEYQSPVAPPLAPVGPFDAGKRYRSREQLGTRTIDGLDAIGTRETVTVAPGTIGNNRELQGSREFWYSSDLQTNLIVIRKDPLNGTVEIHLNILSRADPDSAIFVIPEGYTVQDKRPPASP